MIFELSFILALIAGAGIILSIIMLLYARNKINSSSVLIAESQDRLKNTKREIENERREAFLKIKKDR